MPVSGKSANATGPQIRPIRPLQAHLAACHDRQCRPSCGRVRTADFDYDLPPELIAQAPAPRRDQSRLLVLDRRAGQLAHRQFRDLPEYLRHGDALVLNDSRVLPARLHGRNARTGGQFEVLLVEENAANDWWTMVRPGKRARTGTEIVLHDLQGRPSHLRAIVVEVNTEGHRRLRFSGIPDIAGALDALGEVPLPPYITRPDAGQTAADRERYQTVFARPHGSVAAPTAGLHFTEALLGELRSRGVRVCFVTLHVGLGTFAPVKAETLAAHIMHEERYVLSEETAAIINETRESGRRVFAVGTTSLRVLESAATQSAQGRPESPAFTVAAGFGKTRLFIYPPFNFRIADALLTNFHLPRSTLLMLVSAFAAPGETDGRALVLSAYQAAIQARHRFFSYGDAMLLL